MPHKRAKQSVREQKKKERGADLAPPSNNNGAGISTERIPKSAARVLDAAKIRAEYRQKRARLQIEGSDANRDHVGAPKPPPRKKRRTDAGASVEKGTVSTKGKGRPVDTIEIQPGESLKHFNRRVEDHMRPLVQSAMRASAATERKARKTTMPSSNVSTTKVSNKPEQQQQPSPSLTSSNAHKKTKGPMKDGLSSLTAQHDNDDDDDRPKEFAITSSAAPRRLNDIAMAPPELKRLPRGATKRGDGNAAKAPAAAAGVLSMAQRIMMETERENAIKRYREMKERKAKEGERHVDEG